MAKAAFFYANSSSYLLNLLEVGFATDTIALMRTGDKVARPIGSLGCAVIKGLNSKTYLWDGTAANDPFPQMLDPESWDITRIRYPDDGSAIGAAITYGVSQTVDLIKGLPGGQKFAIGGSSQGAAVMAGVYDQIKNSAGSLYYRRNDFLGGVAFGNPRRQLNYRGDPTVAGSWSGTWEAATAASYRWYQDATPNSTGGHGSFPSTGTWARLTGCETAKWQEFTTPGDIFSSTGDATNGANWTAAIGALLSLPKSQYFGDFQTQTGATSVGVTSAMLTAINAARALAIKDNLVIDGIENSVNIGGLGHTIYALLPPPGSNGVIPVFTQTVDGKVYLKPNGLTCYQLALAWLEAMAAGLATSPLLLPSDRTKGWTVTPFTPVQVNLAATTSSSSVIAGNVNRVVIVERPTGVAMDALFSVSRAITANRSGAVRMAARIAASRPITATLTATAKVT
jgi:hypothetical protein